MYIQNASADDGSKGKVVKCLVAISPDCRGAVFPRTLIGKSIHLRYLLIFMVAANENNAIRIAHLEGKEEEEGLDGVEPSIDKVAEEEIVRSTEKSSHVPKLVMKSPQMATGASTVCTCTFASLIRIARAL